MILLVASAHAHDLVGPHTHDPATVAVLGAWVVAAVVFFAVTRRLVLTTAQ